MCLGIGKLCIASGYKSRPEVTVSQHNVPYLTDTGWQKTCHMNYSFPWSVKTFLSINFLTNIMQDSHYEVNPTPSMTPAYSSSHEPPVLLSRKSDSITLQTTMEYAVFSYPFWHRRNGRHDSPTEDIGLSLTGQPSNAKLFTWSCFRDLPYRCTSLKTPRDTHPALLSMPAKFSAAKPINTISILYRAPLINVPC